MTDAEVIDKFGGPSKLAGLLKAKSRQHVHNWIERGIPIEMRFAIEDLAKKHKVKLPKDFVRGSK